MSVKSGSTLYNASEGYDADAWDDSALIKAYDRAMQSGRELIQTRKGGNKRSWDVGSACRAIWSEDGEEYEGTVVQQHPAKKRVTVRFHGYNNEDEVRVSELMDSLGQDAVDDQIEQAERDKEIEEEEPGAGDEFRLGDWCRAEWSEDGVVYEAVIEKVNRKNKTAVVKFLGFGNQEEKDLDDLYMSKGEEWREEQENIGTEQEPGIKEEELHNLIAKNCPDLLANFGVNGSEESSDINLALDSLAIKEEVAPKSKSKSKKTKKSNSLSDKPVKTSTLPSQNGSLNQSSWHPSGSSSIPSFGSFPSMPHHMQMPSPMGLMPPNMQMPSSMVQMPNHMQIPSQMSTMPSFSSPMGMMMPNMFSSIPAFPQFAPGLQHPQIPANAPLDQLHQASGGDPALKAMLLSWYNAGFHSGFYQGSKKPVKKEKNKKN